MILLNLTGWLVAGMTGVLLAFALSFFRDEQHQIYAGFAAIIVLGMILVKIQ